jgi:hypothetical protein
VNGVDYEDAVMTACIYAWSLADWLRLEREVQARFATKREWHQHLARTQRRLRQVRDVANGAKHRLLDDHHVEGQRTSVLNEVFREDDWPRTFVMYEFRHPGEPPERIEGLALAHLARRAWDDVLADLGLLTRSTREGEV